MITVGATATWGVTAYCAGVSGVVTSVSVATEGIFLDERNDENQVCGHYLTDMKVSVNVTLQVGATVTAPEVGENFSIGRRKFIVSRCELIEGNTQFRKFSISADAYPNVSGDSFASKKLSKTWSKEMGGTGDLTQLN